MARFEKLPVVKTVTKDGECVVTISLDININLNQNGINIGVTTVEKQEEEKVDFVVPEFGNKKVAFGKKV